LRVQISRVDLARRELDFLFLERLPPLSLPSHRAEGERHGGAQLAEKKSKKRASTKARGAAGSHTSRRAKKATKGTAPNRKKRKRRGPPGE
jgi:hypothetical protein